MEEINYTNLKVIPFENIPSVISLKDLQSILGIGKTLSYNLVGNKLIPAFKVGREWKILKTDLISFIEKTQNGVKNER